MRSAAIVSASFSSASSHVQPSALLPSVIRGRARR